MATEHSPEHPSSEGASDASLQERETAERRRLEAARVTVLVVEDDPSTREGLEETLLGWGFQVVAVGSAEEAEFAVRNRRPDMAIIDVFLPGRSGAALLNRLRERFPDAILIATSGLGDAEMSRDLKGVGADTFLEKPLRLEALAAAMRAGHRSWH